jgi:hypothetical protein
MARHTPGVRSYEDPRERNFHALLREEIATIARERADKAHVLSPKDCADLILAFRGRTVPDDLTSWIVISLENGRERGKPRRRLKDEAALRAARRDYRRYGAWLRDRDVPDPHPAFVRSAVVERRVARKGVRHGPAQVRH